MDPNQSAYHAQAQMELRELFQELACNGQVSAAELQRSLVPFTAGDVKRDLLELIAEMKRKQLRLDEPGFLRVMWRKMYLSSVIDTSKSTMPRDSSTGTERGAQSQPINVSLAHVIVSIKRRSQLKQFAGYYASRGISGADHLASPPKRGKAAAKTSSPSGRKEPSSPCSHRTSNQPNPLASDASLESIETLRRRQSPFYDVVACVFDADRLEMQTRTLLARTRTARVHNCSRLYCLLFAKDAGSFILGSTYFAKKAQRDHQREKDEYNIVSESISESTTTSWIGKGEQGLLMLRMEELGLRNVVAAASSQGTFAVCTEHKVHQWRAPEPYRVLQSGRTDDSRLFNADQSPQDHGEDGGNERDDEENEAEAEEASTTVELLGVDPPGDCFGLLGGKPLVARAKTIADVVGLRQLAAGENFLVGVSSLGELYSWDNCPTASSSSSSTVPLLGRGSTIPERVPWYSLSERVYRVACGLHHVVALSSSGVYAWGSNIYGQLGLGAHCSASDAHILEPALVPLPVTGTPVVDVACGDLHSIVLSASGLVFAFGCNWEGQLGIDESRTDSKAVAVASTGCAYEPMPVFLSGSLESMDVLAYLIVAGPQTSAAVATTGQVFQWGKFVSDGLEGVCGCVSRWLPEELKALKAPGPIWHSIAIADGLVVLTKHSTTSNTH